MEYPASIAPGVKSKLHEERRKSLYLNYLQKRSKGADPSTTTHTTMTEYQVSCINKPNRQSTHEHITHIGNLETKWRMTREDAIQRIDAKSAQFFTVDRQTGKRCYVGVVRESGKAPYLRTHADGKWNDNLLAQAECDGSCTTV